MIDYKQMGKDLIQIKREILVHKSKLLESGIALVRNQLQMRIHEGYYFAVEKHICVSIIIYEPKFSLRDTCYALAQEMEASGEFETVTVKIHGEFTAEFSIEPKE